MKRKIALILALAMTVCSLSGCGKKGYEYTSPSGSFSLTLPSEDWEVTTEDADQGMYVFSLPATSDAAAEATGLDTDAIIIYFDLSEEAGNLGYDTIPTTQDELETSLGEDLDYEVLDFEGDLNEDGVKTNTYSIKFTSDGSTGYIVSKTEANESKGYIIAGEVLSDNAELLEDITETVNSVKKNDMDEVADAADTAAEEETEEATEEVTEAAK